MESTRWNVRDGEGEREGEGGREMEGERWRERERSGELVIHPVPELLIELHEVVVTLLQTFFQFRLFRVGEIRFSEQFLRVAVDGFEYCVSFDGT